MTKNKFPDINSLNKDISFKDFLIRCNIPGVKGRTVEKIVIKTKNITTLRDFIENSELINVLKTINGIGEETAQKIFNYLNDLDFMFLLDDMESSGYEIFKDNYIYSINELDVHIKEIEDGIDVDVPNELKGKRVCVTGTFHVPRAIFKNFIEKNQGIFQTQVNNKTDILVYSLVDGTSTIKYNKATDINKKAGKEVIKMLTEEEFVKWTKKLGIYGL